MFKTTLILITQADATDLIRERGKRQRRRGERRGEGREKRALRAKGGKTEMEGEKEETIRWRKEKKVGAQLVFALKPQFEWYK